MQFIWQFVKRHAVLVVIALHCGIAIAESQCEPYALSGYWRSVLYGLLASRVVLVAVLAALWPAPRRIRILSAFTLLVALYFSTELSEWLRRGAYYDASYLPFSVFRTLLGLGVLLWFGKRIRDRQGRLVFVRHASQNSGTRRLLKIAQSEGFLWVAAVGLSGLLALWFLVCRRPHALFDDLRWPFFPSLLLNLLLWVPPAFCFGLVFDRGRRPRWLARTLGSAVLVAVYVPLGNAFLVLQSLYQLLESAQETLLFELAMCGAVAGSLAILAAGGWYLAKTAAGADSAQLSPDAREPRRWQYTLRTALIAVVLVALAAAWVGSELQRGRRETPAIEWVEKSDGRITYRVSESWLREKLGRWFPGNAQDIRFPFVIYPSRTPLTDISPLAALKNLGSLNLNDTQVSDLTPVAEITNLANLDIDRTPASDLTPLAHFQQLRTLYARETPVTELAPLAGLPQLLYLNLDDTPVHDITPLSRTTSLRDLSLAGTQVSDLSPLAHLEQLRELDISNTPVSDLGPLATCANLSVLIISGSRVSDLSQLSAIRTLTTLDLNNCSISNLTPLGSLVHLRAINIGGTQVTDLSPLEDLDKLSFISIADTPIADLDPLKELPNLETLRLSNSQKLALEDELAELQQALPECQIDLTPVDGPSDAP